ncbi:MAG TPA: hypothetical protein VER35_02725 [Candidatus Limnocylindrales bacterium]|nr:hypothetical protein [Candidatus Limnocylindrales bacterium]
MGYTTGAKILPAIIDDIAAALIATSGGYWTDADTAWTTATKTGNLARRALKYTNGGEVVYLALECINTMVNTFLQSSVWTYSKGLKITFSASWDSVGHMYGASNYYTFIAFEAYWYSNNYADMATLQVIFYLWVDATGFAIMAKPEPSSNNYQGSWLAVVERNPNKEYSDGFSNFYGYFQCNAENNNYTAGWEMRQVLRPFTFFSQDYNQQSWSGIDMQGIVFPLCPYLAYKSTGNGKVYYVKPIICNSRDERTPIFQSEIFFAFDENVGLVDGDVIAIEGETTKYLCKALDSPDSTTRLTFAIKYVA